MSDSEYKRIQKKVKERKEFYQHLTTYLVMGVFFYVFNMLTSFDTWWWYWPMLGWGIGLASHYFQVFGLPGVGRIDEEWEQKEIEKELRQLRPGNEAEDGEYLDLPELEKNKNKNWSEEDLV
jgi:hypothetical protein